MRKVETDVLVIGGGIAGSFAAIRARKCGRSVAVLEKATLARGGSVGPGMDHISLGVHPRTISYEQAREFAKSAKKDLNDPNITLAVDVNAYDRVKDFEEFGVPVRNEDGEYFIWNDPDRHFNVVSYKGVDTKVRLGEAVYKYGAQVYERTMGVRLLTKDGKVTGALGMNTRSGEMTAFFAKATILSTGEMTRQYIAPDGPFNTYFAQTNSGDSEAMAYDAGAEMVNMEFLYWDYVIVRAGGGIVGVKPLKYMGKLYNRLGESVLNTREDYINRCYIMHKEIIEGRAPLYWDLSELPDEILDMYEQEMSNEFPITKQWFKQRGIDIRKDRIPMKLDPCCVMGGPFVDEKLQTSVPGLYAAGATTAFARAIVGSSVTGDLAGKYAAEYCENAELCLADDAELERMEKEIKAPLSRESGVSPVETELAVRKIITEDVGYFKSEEMLRYAQEKLQVIRDRYIDNMKASNIHELMRCNEAKSILTCAELHVKASMVRKESRYRHMANFVHYRVDYPEKDPAWEKWIILKKTESGDVSVETREVPELREEQA